MWGSRIRSRLPSLCAGPTWILDFSKSIFNLDIKRRGPSFLYNVDLPQFTVGCYLLRLSNSIGKSNQTAGYNST